MIKGIRINKSKIVHLYHFAADRTDCGAGGMSDLSVNAGTPTEDAVTCKRCLKSMAAAAELAARVAAELQETVDVVHGEALRMDAARSAASVALVASTRKQRRADRRQRRATLRKQAPQMRAAARVRRGEREGLPQTARTLLVAAGVPEDVAKRYAPAFSRGTKPTTISNRRVRVGRRTKRTDVKLYSQEAFAARMATYRPFHAGLKTLFAAASRRVNPAPADVAALSTAYAAA